MCVAAARQEAISCRSICPIAEDSLKIRSPSKCWIRVYQPAMGKKKQKKNEADSIGGAAAAAQTGDVRMCLSLIGQISHSGKYGQKNKQRISLTDSEKI